MKNQVKTRKKLIEVALPLEAINVACAREKSIRHGHPSTLHLWWARRPLAAARAVIFAQMVDDPSSHPELFPTEKAQAVERKRLFTMMEKLVLWENTTNDQLLEQARAEIWQSWRSTCADNAGHPSAKELFDRHKLPAFHDPFAGGGAIPLEAQRLGLESHASDLNPVAVLINKAMIEIPPKFSGREAINPDWQKTAHQDKGMLHWQAAQGLAKDVEYYGNWLRREAQKRIGELYEPIEVSEEMAHDRPDLQPYVGERLTVIAWLWARTVLSPNPAFSQVEVPLVSSFNLSTKTGKEAYVEPLIEEGGYRFAVRLGKSRDATTENGTKLSRGANFRCLMSNTPIPSEYIYNEANAGRMGSRLMAVVVEGKNKRLYLDPTDKMATVAKGAEPAWAPELAMPNNPRWFSPPLYGLKTFGDLFTSRQLLALSTLSELVEKAIQQVRKDAIKSGMPDDGIPLREGGLGAEAYAEAIAIYLGFLVDQQSNQLSTCCGWNNINQQMIVTFSLQAIQMKWDFAECNLFSKSTGSFANLLERQVKAFESLAPGIAKGFSSQANAAEIDFSHPRVVSTDPPYYDNIGYADLSDFFYVWLRHSLYNIFPAVFATVSTPKREELTATPDRHGGKQAAESFFLNGMTKAMNRLTQQAHPAIPVTIYYAFKQSEQSEISGRSSTGWETFLGAVINAGFAITGTWPVKTESANKLKAKVNALASSIVLVCRRREPDAPTASLREFLSVLKQTVPAALVNLQRGNIAPVDLAQAAIGPGMAVFTRYSKVIDADGKPIAVKQALATINDVLDEVLAEQEGDFDSDTRWALTWFDQFGFTDGEYGVAETLANARNTSIEGMRSAGILASKSGRVRLLKPEELPADWDPSTDNRLTAWEIVHHLVRTLSTGEAGAAELAGKLGSQAEMGRELAYRLYSICERKKRPQEALAYNGLVQSWPEILSLSRQSAAASPIQKQNSLFMETA